MATTKKLRGPGEVTNISGGVLNVPALVDLCVIPRSPDVQPKETVKVTEVSGFDLTNWKVKAI